MQNKRKPNRLKGFDYSSDSLYFVTPVVLGRICFFGEIVDDEMQLNNLGKMVERQWFWLADQYPYVKLHSFQIMPNHAHGIIEISRDQVEDMRNLSKSVSKSDTSIDQNLMEGNSNEMVGTGRDLSVGNNLNAYQEGLKSDNKNHHAAGKTGRDLSLQTLPLKIKSLSELMGAFKMTSSKHIHLLEEAGADYAKSLPHPSKFAWQRSFYDHIIVSQKSLETISDYIETNPQTWKDDKFFR